MLTAASCTSGKTNFNIDVLLGGHNVEDSTKTTVRVDDITIDPKYSGGRPYNYDFAILTLTEEIQFSRTVSPACLPSDITELYTGQVATVTGWGWHDNPTLELASKLQEVDVTVLLT